MVDSRVLVFLTSWLALSRKCKVLAVYCDNDKCDFDEYCCGHNICCTSYNVWQMWYFWLGLVLFLILLAGCFSFWRYRYQQALVIQSCSHTGYNPLQPHINIPSAEQDSSYTHVESGGHGHTYNVDRGGGTNHPYTTHEPVYA